MRPPRTAWLSDWGIGDMQPIRQRRIGAEMAEALESVGNEAAHEDDVAVDRIEDSVCAEAAVAGEPHGMDAAKEGADGDGLIAAAKLLRTA